MPRIDRYLSSQLRISRRDVRLMLAQRRVEVDGILVSEIAQRINKFSVVRHDGVTIQDIKARYLMLNKPAGTVSATIDDSHRTLIDLLDYPEKEQLHIVGRLDYNSTGLVLLTNDGSWSKKLTRPENHYIKRYRVRLEKPLRQEHVEAFSQGMYFAFENITTRPAHLRILSRFEAEVALTEGRYHQIRRMFGRFQNKVLSLHRIAIGSLTLDPTLSPGSYRELSIDEVTESLSPLETPCS